VGVETHNCASLRGVCACGEACRDGARPVSTAIGGYSHAVLRTGEFC